MFGRSLAETGNSSKDVIRALRERIDANADDKPCAILALIKLRNASEENTTALLKVIEKRDFKNLVLLNSFGSCEEPRLLKVLKELLSSKDVETQQYGIQALGYVGANDPDCLRLILK